MARHKDQSGRVTRTPQQSERESGVQPFRRRRPVVYWFVILATLAMVLTTFASFFQAVS